MSEVGAGNSGSSNSNETSINILDDYPSGNVVTTIYGGSSFSVTQRVTSGGELWGYVPNFDGYSGWVLLDPDDVDLVKTDTGSRQILLDPDTGFTIGKYPLYATDATTGNKTLNPGNASMWVDYAGNLHIKGELSATSLLIDGLNADEYIENTAPRIRLIATTLMWNSANSSMTESGILTCQGAVINGSMECVTEEESEIPVITPSGQSVVESYITMQFINGRLNFRDDNDNLLARMSFGSEFRIDSNKALAISALYDMSIDTAMQLSINSEGGIDINSVGKPIEICSSGTDGNIRIETDDAIISVVKVEGAEDPSTGMIVRSGGIDITTNDQDSHIDISSSGTMLQYADGAITIASGTLNNNASIVLEDLVGIAISAPDVYLRASAIDAGVGVDNNGNFYVINNNTKYTGQTMTVTVPGGTLVFQNGILV